MTINNVLTEQLRNAEKKVSIYNMALTLITQSKMFRLSGCPEDTDSEFNPATGRYECSDFKQYGKTVCRECWENYFIKKAEEEK